MDIKRFAYVAFALIGLALQDSNAALTSALLTFDSTGPYDGFSATSTPNLATNTMYRGGLVGSNITPEVTVTVTGIPYAKYDLYVYASADSTATDTLANVDAKPTRSAEFSAACTCAA